MRSIGSKGFIKRALPFLATFAIALFITSFFVDLNRPRFGHGFRMRRFDEMQRLRMENDQLRDENERLRGMGNFDPGMMMHPGREMDLDVAPMPPIAPHAHK